MSAFNFSKQEKEFILKAISMRRTDCETEFSKRHLVELDKIEGELKLDISNLTPKNKSIIIGCLRETFIYPNENLLNISDFHILFTTGELLSRMQDLDIVMHLLNKLRKKSEPKYRLFTDSLKKINGLLKSDRILYSTTPNGKVYKAGILIEGKKGITFELDGWSEPGDFEVGHLEPQSYMNIGSPAEVRTILNDYSVNYELSEMQVAFNKILDRISR